MELATNGLKGRDHTLKLKHLNLITGPGASGKTTIAQAFRFVAQGSDPSIGRRPMDTAALMRGQSMAVTLSFGKKAIRRTLGVKDGKFVRGASASWISEKSKATIHSEEIRQLFGANDDEVYQSLDSRALFALSPSDRSELLQSLIGSEEEDPAKIAEEVWAWMVQRLVYPKKKGEPKNWEENIWPMVKKHHLPILEGLSLEFQAKIAAVDIGETIDWANERKRLARSDIERKEAARQELHAKVMLLPETHPDEIARMERERDGLQSEVGAWKQRKTDWEAREEKAKVARVEMKASLEKIGDLGERAEKVSAKMDDIEAKRDEYKDVRDRIDTMTPPAQGDYRAAGDLRKDAKALRERAEKIAIPEEVDLEPLSTEVQSVQSELSEADENPWTEVSEIASRMKERSSRLKKKSDALADIERLRVIADDHGTEDLRLEIRQRLDAAENVLEAAKDENAAIAKQRDAGEKKRKPLLERAEAKETEAEAIEAKIDLEHEDSKVDFANRKDELIEVRKKLKKEIDAFETEQRDVQKDTTAAKAEVESAKSVLAALGPAKPAPDESEGEDLESSLQGAKDALQSLGAAVAKRDALEEIIKEIEKAKAESEIYAALEYALKLKRDRGVTARGGTLIDTMRTFLYAADREEVPYIRAVPGTCEIGWRGPNGDERSVEAMCGSEWCIFASALASAVIIARDASFRILLVEADDIGGEPFHAMLRGIEAVRKGLTLVVVITQHRDSVERAGPPWNIIDMGLEAAA